MGNAQLRKALGRAIRSHEEEQIRRLLEDEAEAAHDNEHDDGFDIFPDPYCRICRDAGYLEDLDD